MSHTNTITPADTIAATFTCGYCDQQVEQDSHGSWRDVTDGDCCPGNDCGDNGVHDVFSPVQGHDCVCVSAVLDPDYDDPKICLRCFHPTDTHPADSEGVI